MELDYLIALSIFAAIYGVVFGGLGAYIAGQKRRSTTEGLILGALFGPLGVLLVAILPTGVGSTSSSSSRRSSPLSSDRGPSIQIKVDDLVGDQPKPKPQPDAPPIAVRRIRKP